VEKNYKIHVIFKVGTQPESVKDINGVTISVAPNPVNDRLFVTGLYNKLEIVTVSGQVVSVMDNYQPSIDVSHLAKGVYFVKIYTNGASGNFKIVK
jgi:hypothetical protein